MAGWLIGLSAVEWAGPKGTCSKTLGSATNKRLEVVSMRLPSLFFLLSGCPTCPGRRRPPPAHIISAASSEEVLNSAKGIKVVALDWLHWRRINEEGSCRYARRDLPKPAALRSGTFHHHHHHHHHRHHHYPQHHLRRLVGSKLNL